MSDLPNWALPETSTPATRTAEPAAPAAPSPVIARYLTVGGMLDGRATVDITTEVDGDPSTPYRAKATCTATLCGWQEFDYADRHHGNFDRALHLVQQAAQDHASTCRAMVDPGGAT